MYLLGKILLPYVCVCVYECMSACRYPHRHLLIDCPCTGDCLPNRLELLVGGAQGGSGRGHVEHC